MSRQVFTSNNKVGQTLQFNHQSYSGGSDPQFNPVITMKGGKRVSWDFGDGNTFYEATNTPNYTYNSGPATTKTVIVRTQRLSDIIGFESTRDRIMGNLDLSGLELEGDFSVKNSIGLTGITHTYSDGVFTEYLVNNQFTSTQATDITGNHDMSMLPGLGGSFDISANPNLTGITHTPSIQVFTQYKVDDCDITGNYDLTMFPNLGGVFAAGNNSNLTGITHTASTQTFTDYNISNSDITGNHDLSMFPNLGGEFQMNDNLNLTGITHTTSNEIFTRYQAGDCNLLGNHDLTMFPNLGGVFNIIRNSNLQSVSHTASTQLFTSYALSYGDLQGEHDISMLNLSGTITLRNNANLTGVTRTSTTNNINNYVLRTCDITGNHDMTIYPNLGGNFEMQSNPNLTGVTHTATTRTFTNYELNACDITGNHDMSMLPGLGGNFNISSNVNLTLNTLGGSFLFYSNPNLTDFNFNPTGSTETFTRFQGYDCDLTTSNFDLSIFPNITKTINLHNNPNLSGITFPTSVGTFSNRGPSSNNDTSIGLNQCNLGYVNFYPLSGATMDVNDASGCDIFLQDNNMSTTDVNHIFVDLSGITSNNLSTWSGVTFNIGGTNSAPDGSTGGYNGLSALSYLTGATPSGGGWTVITS
jgi:hypothetical protein